VFQTSFTVRWGFGGGKTPPMKPFVLHCERFALAVQHK